ncbi:MAG: aldA, partial [Rhizobacter sp.]|nr:aldA [Rhizobacter sp.]
MQTVEQLQRFDHYIDGRSVPPAGGEYFPTDDPYTGLQWALVARGNAADADAAVQAASRAFEQGAWPALTPSQRGQLLWKLGELVQANAERLAAIEQRDNGKLSTEVIAQVRYMGDYFKYYAGLADKVQGAVIPTDKKGVFTYTRYEAKGVIAIITPWNSPLTLTSWKLAPALAAGCT